MYDDPKSPDEGGVLKICDGPESPNEQVRGGVFRIYDEP